MEQERLKNWISIILGNMKFHLPSIQKKTANTKSCFIFPNGEVEVKAISKKYQSKLYSRGKGLLMMDL